MTGPEEDLHCFVFGLSVCHQCSPVTSTPLLHWFLVQMYSVIDSAAAVKVSSNLSHYPIFSVALHNASSLQNRRERGLDSHVQGVSRVLCWFSVALLATLLWTEELNRSFFLLVHANPGYTNRELIIHPAQITRQDSNQRCHLTNPRVSKQASVGSVQILQ